MQTRIQTYMGKVCHALAKLCSRSREEILAGLKRVSVCLFRSVSVYLFRSICLGVSVSVCLSRSVSLCLRAIHTDEHTHDVNNAVFPGCARVCDVDNALATGRHSQHRLRLVHFVLSIFKKHCKAEHFVTQSRPPQAKA